MAKGLKIAFILLVVLLSCSQPKKENLIIGKWVYHHTENGGREDFTLEDSLKYTAEPTGSIIQFLKNDSVEFFQPQYGTRKSKYQLLQQGSLLTVNHPKDNGADTSKIEVTNRILKISADRLVLVFNKQQ